MGRRVPERFKNEKRKIVRNNVKSIEILQICYYYLTLKWQRVGNRTNLL